MTALRQLCGVQLRAGVDAEVALLSGPDFSVDLVSDPDLSFDLVSDPDFSFDLLSEPDFSAASDLDVSALLAAGLEVLPFLKSVAYQPEPFSWNPAAVTCLLKEAAPQAGQTASG